jgi:hypothetical protein
MSVGDDADEARRGWDSDFVRFASTPSTAIVAKLRAFLFEASREQVHAWDDSIPQLQTEVEQVRELREEAGRYTAILEYQLPMEERRADAIFLLRESVVVIELKGKSRPSDADIDQAHAYARDLRCYHAECENRIVHALLIPTRATGDGGFKRGVRVCGPDVLDAVIAEYDVSTHAEIVDARRFLSQDAYRPLPTLVSAARELFLRGTLRRIKRAAAATDGAADSASRIAHVAAQTRSRRLVLLTGVPGAGKTLVGLRLVHSHFIDDLAVQRKAGKPTAPAVFLSGNDPLVSVLQYELREAGGGGRTFVRRVKDYVARYARTMLVPPEHVLVYDEAQRAFDAEKVAATHPDMATSAKSEPEIFIELAQRIPDWSVIVALVGSGQEIHSGEEGGAVQWADAIRKSDEAGRWMVHGPPSLCESFIGLAYISDPLLNLDRSLRSHLSTRVHEFVAGLVARQPGESVKQSALAALLAAEGYDLRITRDLDIAKRYLRDRYADDDVARFGLVASSRDRDLVRFGIPNDFQSTKRVRFGPWYGDPESASGKLSCRHLEICVTEFGAQGLELDAVLLAWGTDFVRDAEGWSIERARRYSPGGPRVKDAWQLRANAYRVLLTRARDATVVFVPPLSELDRTYEWLVACGFRPLSDMERTYA